MPSLFTSVLPVYPIVTPVAQVYLPLILLDYPCSGSCPPPATATPYVRGQIIDKQGYGVVVPQICTVSNPFGFVTVNCQSNVMQYNQSIVGVAYQSAIGVQVNVGNNVIIGVTPEIPTAGVYQNGNQYVWNAWNSGARRVTFVVASPTPTPTPTRTPTPTKTPTPTPTNTPTATPIPYLRVRVQNPQGTPVSKYFCKIGGSSTTLQETGACYTKSDHTFWMTTLTDRLYMGVYINPGSDILTGVTNASAGGTLDRWSGGYRDYSWARWWTGTKSLIFRVASPTPTPIPTPTKTPTPTNTFTPTPTNTFTPTPTPTNTATPTPTNTNTPTPTPTNTFTPTPTNTFTPTPTPTNTATPTNTPTSTSTPVVMAFNEADMQDSVMTQAVAPIGVLVVMALVIIFWRVMKFYGQRGAE